jgi:hypothetical protein
MRQKLFTVEDNFYVSGRSGTVIVGNSRPNLPIFKIGENVLLVRPNNTELIAEIGVIEMPVTVSGVKKAAISIENVTKEDVPIGTEVFLDTQKI